MASNEVLVKILTDDRQARQSLANIDKSTKETQSTLDKFSNVAKLAFGAVALSRIKGFADSAKQAASDLGESVNAVNVVFGTAAEEVLNFGKTAAYSVGLSNRAFNELATPLGAMLKNAGFDAGTAADQVITLTQRASDMASVFNTDVSDALGAIQAALRGESDPIEKYGVSLNAAAVDAEAAALGFDKLAGQYDNNAKAAARLSLIMKQTDQVMGDFKRTQGDLANASRTVAAAWEDQKAQIGDQLLPIYKGATQATGYLIDVGNVLAAAFTSQSVAAASTLGTLHQLVREGIDPTADKASSMATVLLTAGDASRDWADSVATLKDQLGPTAGELQTAAGKVQEFGKQFGLSQEQIDAAASALMTQARSTSEAGRAAQRHKPHIEGLSIAEQSLASHTAAASDELRKQADPLYALVSAQDDVNAATKTVLELQQEGKTGTQEYRDAVLDASKKMLELNSASARYNEEGGQASIDAVAESLRLLGLTNEQIDALIKSIGILNQTPVNQIISQGGSGNRGIKAFAEGGVVPGPRGSPQLILAHGGETVLPTHKGGYTASGGGVTVNLTVQGSLVHQQDVGRYLEDVLTRYKRSAGALSFQ